MRPSLPLPRSLTTHARWLPLGSPPIPTLLVHPDWDGSSRVPLVIWMHGRTAYKELDPGRYLRLLRAGIGVCAVDLPGHGERLDPVLQQADHALEVVIRMMGEIDPLVSAIETLGVFDETRLGIGGMSAGGMAALARLCRPHPFRCVSVEATTGSWRHQRHHAMFHDPDPDATVRYDPLQTLDAWREIPFQAFHSRADAWVDHDGQAAFVTELRRRYERPDLIEFIVYDRTGAPHEHIGFGTRSAEVKNLQRDFFVHHLQPVIAGPSRWQRSMTRG